MKKTFSYDKKNDILFVHMGFSSDEKFLTNIESGNFIFDVSTKNAINGLEIFNASDYFENLNEAIDVEFTVNVKKTNIVVNLILKERNKVLNEKIIVSLEDKILVS